MANNAAPAAGQKNITITEAIVNVISKANFVFSSVSSLFISCYVFSMSFEFYFISPFIVSLSFSELVINY
jgi:hypothetical protein